MAPKTDSVVICPKVKPDDDLRLYLPGREPPDISKGPNFFRAVLDRPMQHEPGFTVRRMPGGLNDRGLRAGQLKQPTSPTSRAVRALDVTAERIVASTHRRPLEGSGGLRTTKG
jgi:hypothetical protein